LNTASTPAPVGLLKRAAADSDTTSATPAGAVLQENNVAWWPIPRCLQAMAICDFFGQVGHVDSIDTPAGFAARAFTDSGAFQRPRFDG